MKNIYSSCGLPSESHELSNRLELLSNDYKSLVLPAELTELMEQIIRIELTSSAWQADALTVVLYLRFVEDENFEIPTLAM